MAGRVELVLKLGEAMLKTLYTREGFEHHAHLQGE